MIINLYFWPCRVACRIFIPPPGFEPVPPTVEAWSPNHWTAREVPIITIFKETWQLPLPLLGSQPRGKKSGAWGPPCCEEAQAATRRGRGWHLRAIPAKWVKMLPGCSGEWGAAGPSQIAEKQEIVLSQVWGDSSCHRRALRQPFWTTVWRCLLKLDICIPRAPDPPLLGINPTGMPQKMNTRMFAGTQFVIAQTEKTHLSVHRTNAAAFTRRRNTQQGEHANSCHVPGWASQM